MIRVGIVGASGYTGQECVRILSKHSQCKIVALFANKLAGTTTQELFNNDSSLPKSFDTFDPNLDYDIDCLFLAVPHTTAHVLMSQIGKNKAYKVIDLSADFRLSCVDRYNQTYNQKHSCSDLLEKFVYGVPELYFDAIKESKFVANPGCFAIASILALFPLAANQLIDNAIIDAKTGVSGAGKALDESLLFCEVNEQVRAYKTNKHRHSVEINQACGINVLFSPHLVPMQRGILASCYVTVNKSITKKDCVDIFNSCYKNQPFILINDSPVSPSTKHVVRSNMCELSIIDTQNNGFVIFSAIDNLIKGSAGNAVQCMNIMFGLDQDFALDSIAQRV